MSKRNSKQAKSEKQRRAELRKAIKAVRALLRSDEFVYIER